MLDKKKTTQLSVQLIYASTNFIYNQRKEMRERHAQSTASMDGETGRPRLTNHQDSTDSVIHPTNGPPWDVQISSTSVASQPLQASSHNPTSTHAGSPTLNHYQINHLSEPLSHSLQ